MRGSLSVVAVSATAGLALLCTAFPTNHPPSPRSGGATARQANTPILQYSNTPSLQPPVAAAPSGSAGHYPEAPASIITVTTTNDAGPGSLRQALADAQDG